MHNEQEIKSKIEEAISTSISMSSAANKLNMSFSTFRRWATKFQMYKPNQGRKGIKIVDIESHLVEKSSARTNRLKNLLIKHGYIENACAECGIKGEWNNKPIVLEMDHINGVRDDHRRENLRILCPNCHSQTSTFRGRNTKAFKRAYTDEELKEAIKECCNEHQLALKLGIASGGGNCKYLKKNIDRLKLRYKERDEDVLLHDLSGLYKKRKHYSSSKHCKCGKAIKRRSTTCYDCMHKNQRRAERPSFEILKKEIEDSNYSAVGRKYGVSDNAIRKWMKSYEES